MRLLSSQMASPGPIVFGRTPAPAGPRKKVPWPRFVDGRIEFHDIDTLRIPPGWQQLNCTVPMRRATCEETDCPLFLSGWTRIEVPGIDDILMTEGRIEPDQAAQIYGYFGPASIPPGCQYHEPGSPCLQVHKLPNGLPPVYNVDGRTVLWNEFEDAIGGGIHQTQKLQREGHY
jgi:hypothetical protein